MTVVELIRKLEKEPPNSEVRIEGAAIGRGDLFHDTVMEVYLKHTHKVSSPYVVIQGDPFGSMRMES